LEIHMKKSFSESLRDFYPDTSLDRSQSAANHPENKQDPSFTKDFTPQRGLSGRLLYMPNGYAAEPTPHDDQADTTSRSGLENESDDSETIDEALNASATVARASSATSSAENTPPYAQLCEPSQLMILECCRGSNDLRKAADVLRAQLKADKCKRRLALVPDNYQHALNALREEFPNMSAVLDYLSGQLALASLGNGVIAFAPMLLNGPPGIGKTELLHRLAQMLALPEPVVLDFSVAQTSSQLTGSDSHWSNSKSGLCVQTVGLGPIANPIFLLDELEKARKSDGGGYDPLASLYSLLEKRTARIYSDLSFSPPFPLDFSHILWVAACNEADTLAAPILSRFKRFDIEPPTPAQRVGIVQRVFESLRADAAWGAFFEPLSLEVAQFLAAGSLSPREIKVLLLDVVGRVAESGQRHINLDEAKRHLPSKSSTRHPPGFL
jgi:ATP-dependent Lon protease